jgi:hypothetical protein
VVNATEESPPPTREEAIEALSKLGLPIPDSDEQLIRRYMWTTSIHIEGATGADLTSKLTQLLPYEDHFAVS